MRRDGAFVYAESAFGALHSNLIPSLEYAISKGFFPEAYRVAKEFYHFQDKIVLPIVEKNNDAYEAMGVFILNKGETEKDYPVTTVLIPEYGSCILCDRDTFARSFCKYIVMKETAINQIAGNFQNNNFDLENLLHSNLFSEQEKEWIEKYAPNSYAGVLNCLMLPKNEFTIDIYDMVSAPEFKACPVYCKEDIMDYLIKAKDYDRNIAFTISDYARKGVGIRSYEFRFGKYDLPEELEFILRKTKYLCSRFAGIARLLMLLNTAK